MKNISNIEEEVNMHDVNNFKKSLNSNAYKDEICKKLEYNEIRDKNNGQKPKCRRIL